MTDYIVLNLHTQVDEHKNYYHVVTRTTKDSHYASYAYDISAILDKGLYDTLWCNVIRTKEEKPVLDDDAFYKLIIGSFAFSPMPGCCGLVVSHGTWRDKRTIAEFSKDSDMFRECKTALAKKLGYSAMIATTQMKEVASVLNMVKSGYHIERTFTNKRTSNLLGVGIKIIN